MVTTAQVSGKVFKPGDEVELVVSADRLELGGTDSDADNSHQCRIISEEFVGAIVTVLVETPSGHELKIQKQQKELESQDLHAGQTMTVAWPREAVYIIPRS